MPNREYLETIRFFLLLVFKNVLNVKSQNINVKKKSTILEFLAIKISKIKNDNFNLKLIFSGGGVIHEGIIEGATLKIFLKVGQRSTNQNTRFNEIYIKY